MLVSAAFCCFLNRNLNLILSYHDMTLLRFKFCIGCAYSFYTYKSLEGVPGSDAQIQFRTNIEYYLSLRQTWLIIGKKKIITDLNVIFLYLKKSQHVFPFQE